MMMALDNKNIQKMYLEINKQSLITMLNTLLYLSDSGHLERRYVHVAVKSLRMIMVHKPHVFSGTIHTLK